MPRRRVALRAALLCVAFATANIQPAAAATGCVPEGTWPAARGDLAAQVVDLVNAHRARLGLQALAVSPTLTAAATWKARHMAAYSYLAHDDPAPPAARTSGERLAECGYPRASWGENIAAGYETAQAVLDGWLASPGHRANLERPEYRATGVGAAGSRLSWAQAFGSAVDAGSALPAAAPPAPIPAASPTLGAASPRGGQASSTHRTVRVRCGLRSRGVSCRLGGVRGALVRIALTRGGRTYARARARVRSDPARVALHGVRRLRDGRYALVVRAALGSAVRERRLAFVVR